MRKRDHGVSMPICLSIRRSVHISFTEHIYHACLCNVIIQFKNSLTCTDKVDIKLIIIQKTFTCRERRRNISEQRRLKDVSVQTLAILRNYNLSVQQLLGQHWSSIGSMLDSESTLQMADVHSGFVLETMSYPTLNTLKTS